MSAYRRIAGAEANRRWVEVLLPSWYWLASWWRRRRRCERRRRRCRARPPRQCRTCRPLRDPTRRRLPARRRATRTPLSRLSSTWWCTRPAACAHHTHTHTHTKRSAPVGSTVIRSAINQQIFIRRHMLQANQLEGAYWPSLGRLFTFAFSLQCRRIYLTDNAVLLQ